MQNAKKERTRKKKERERKKKAVSDTLAGICSNKICHIVCMRDILDDSKSEVHTNSFVLYVE